MKFEAVGGISVGDLCVQIGGQVDDGNGVEWAFLRTDTTSNTETLGDEGELGVGSNFDTKFSTADNRTRSFALLSALLGFALVIVDNGNTSKFGRHGGQMPAKAMATAGVDVAMVRS